MFLQYLYILKLKILWILVLKNQKINNFTHLTPGGGVPVKTWPNITGLLRWRSGGHRSAVERSQRSFISQVETLDLSKFDASFTVLGALGKRWSMTFMWTAGSTDACRHLCVWCINVCCAVSKYYHSSIPIMCYLSSTLTNISSAIVALAFVHLRSK